MAINISVQYNGGLLPDIILLTQGYYTSGEPVEMPCGGFVFTAYLCNNSILLLLPCLMMYYIVSVLFLLFVWCPCMAINI